MNKKGSRFIPRLVCALAVAAAMSPAMHADISFSLLPSGNPSAIHGTTVAGWGFTITDTTSWLVVNQTDFCVGSGPFTVADLGSNPSCNASIPILGTYSDLTQNLPADPNAYVVGPSSPGNPNGGPFDLSTQTQAFDPVNQLGVGEIAISPSAPGGLKVTGQIVVDYSLFSVSPNNPNFDPTLDAIAFDDTFTANATVTVDSPVSAVPEPTALVLLGTILLILTASIEQRKSSRITR